MDVNAMRWDDVAEGDALPSFSLRMTVARVVASALGTRNLSAIHYNREFARAAGNRDMFVDTYYIQGLIERLVTDWTGPEGFIRHLAMRIRESTCPGDLVTVAGKVVKKYQASGCGMADLEITCAHGLGVSCDAEVTVELPSPGDWRDDPLGAAGIEMPPATPVDVPGAVLPLIGVTAPSIYAGAAVNPWMIQQFLEPVEDRNPIYRDAESARSSRFGGVISPPAMVGVWMMPWTWPYAERPLQPFDLFRQAVPDYPFNIVAQPETWFFRPMRVGDILRAEARLAWVGPEKATRRGIGCFYAIDTSYFNQSDERVARSVFKMFRFKSRDAQAAPTRAWQEVKVGEKLPDKKVPLQAPPDKPVFQGYMEGYLKGWGGGGSSIKTIELDMPEIGGFSLNGFGEIVTLSGEVLRKTVTDGECVLDVSVVSTGYGASTARAIATVSLPAAGAANPRRSQ